MKKKPLLAVALVGLVAAVALAAASANFILEPSVIDQGGGSASSPAHELVGSIGGPVAGTASSADHRIDGILCSITAPDANWLAITQIPTPDTIGPGQSSELKWTSTKDGSFQVNLGGDGSWDSGVPLNSGTCSADVEETETISDASLTDDVANTIYVVVDAGGGDILSKQATIVDDQTSPAITLTQVTVAGTVDDPTVTEVLLNGSSVPVAAGSYSGVVTTGLNSITVEATNGSAESVTRTILIGQ